MVHLRCLQTKIIWELENNFVAYQVFLYSDCFCGLFGLFKCEIFQSIKIKLGLKTKQKNFKTIKRILNN